MIGRLLLVLMLICVRDRGSPLMAGLTFSVRLRLIILVVGIDGLIAIEAVVATV